MSNPTDETPAETYARHRAETPPACYARMRAAIDANLTALHAQLDHHARGPLDWTHVADLARVRVLLDEAVRIRSGA